MSDLADTARTALRAALLDYSHSPGKYQVGLRQPQLLFAALRDVLQIAVGRDGGATGDQESLSLRDSARFFVRTALLYPGADHYALLGLDRKAESADLKDRYRLLMRLLHPDFSGPGAGAWPADSAVRVNRAYDVLSSAVQRRLYDESLAQAPGAAALQGVEARRPRLTPQPIDSDARQSRFKTLATICAVAGIALVIVSLFATGTSETGHLVQRTRAQPEAAPLAAREPAPSPAGLIVKLNDSLNQMLQAPAAKPAEVKPAAPTQLAAAARQAEPARPQQPQLVAQPAPSTVRPTPEPRWDRISPPGPQVAIVPAQPDPKPEVVALAAPAAVPVPSLPPAVAATAVQATPAPRPVPKPGPTLVEAQPLLSQLLQVMESGRGERILTLLDVEARNKPSAQALSRQYDSLVDGARPVRVSHVEFKAEPGDGRLLVVGSFRVLAGEQAIGAIGKKMVLRAEFASREGNVVITGLSGGAVN